MKEQTHTHTHTYNKKKNNLALADTYTKAKSNFIFYARAFTPQLGFDGPTEKVTKLKK